MESLNQAIHTSLRFHAESLFDEPLNQFLIHRRRILLVTDLGKIEAQGF